MELLTTQCWYFSECYEAAELFKYIRIVEQGSDSDNKNMK